MRTTIDIDDPILNDLKRPQQSSGKSPGRLVSDLLAQALAAAEADATSAAPALTWHSKPMHAKVEIADKHALLDAKGERPA
ncbi:MAG: hypothetical protein KF778_19300 [Rhodocyclaceae bacterium]|nr:hypothetical protein [Rhodocyclaceae bacterium]MBX3670555.1 hypothetical protein [Rhodocyclaceae bacterium]